MSMFTVAISCLIHGPNIVGSYSVLFFTALNFTFHHPDVSTTEHFSFGPFSSFFMELFLRSPPVAYWIPIDLGGLSSRVISFCHFILLMVFSRQEYWSGLPFPSPADCILSELSIMTRASWVALHSTAHIFIKHV